MQTQLGNPVNFRDLGGIVADGGRRVRPHRLLRSGELVGLGARDKEILRDVYRLKTVVDFRTEEEYAAAPDKLPDGVRRRSLDLLMAAQDKVANMDNFNKLETAEKARRFMLTVYEALTMNEGAQRKYGEFIRQAAGQREGALLFHCFAGKDRTGIAAAILLTLLGASREDIFSDYMKTNEMRRARNDKLISHARERGESHEALRVLHSVLNVDRGYLESVFTLAEERYGSFENLIRRTMGVTETDIAALRDNYLE